jgi:hypothetical protein
MLRMVIVLGFRKVIQGYESQDGRRQKERQERPSERLDYFRCISLTLDKMLFIIESALPILREAAEGIC